jgi:integrase
VPVTVRQFFNRARRDRDGCLQRRAQPTEMARQRCPRLRRQLLRIAGRPPCRQEPSRCLRRQPARSRPSPASHRLTCAIRNICPHADPLAYPAAEGLYPARNSQRRPVYVTAEPWPGIPVRKGNRKVKAADVAEGTWPNLTSKFKPHDDRHTHATWLDAANLNKMIQMDRRGHAMPSMDAVYNHITLEMRQRLCDALVS